MKQNFLEAITAFMHKNGYKEFSPRAVLFDMDGVLYNSMPNHARAWEQSMREAGLTMSQQEAYLYEGMRGVETIKHIALQQWNRLITDQESQAIYDEKSRLYAAQPKAEKIVGVVDLMQQLKMMGLKIGVVTGSGQHSLLDKLEDEFPGLISRDLMVTSFDVKQGKPMPDPYLKGMRKCHVHPWQTIVVENAPLGVRAGVAAGCFTIAVNTGPLPRTCLEEEGASMVFDTMVELSQQIVPFLRTVDNQHLGTLLRDTTWHLRYSEVIDFITSNRKKPSKHFYEDQQLFYWIKYNRRTLSRGLQPASRKERMEHLLQLLTRYRRLNSYAYANPAANAD